MLVFGDLESDGQIALCTNSLSLISTRLPFGHAFNSSRSLLATTATYIAQYLNIAYTAIFLYDKSNINLTFYSSFLGFFRITKIVAKVLH